MIKHSGYQQLNRQQNQIHSLAYAESDFNVLPPVSKPTTTTEAPEATTKKKGFFSGFTGLFKSKDKEAESTTTQQPTTTKKALASVTTTTTKSTNSISTSTVKPAPLNIPLSTPKVPPRSELPQSNVPVTPSSAPQVPPRSEYPALPPRPTPTQQHASSSTTAAPKKTTKDDFPPLPTQSNNRPPVQQPTVAPSVPNAWGKPPGVVSGPTPKPQSFFTQSGSTTTKPKFSVPTVSTPIAVESGPVSDAELLTLSESLFSKDVHNPFKYVTVNFQGRTQSSAKTDEAAQP